MPSCMKIHFRPLLVFSPEPTPASTQVPPGRVEKLLGVIFQCDASSLLGDIFIRPAESLDLCFAGLRKVPHQGPQAPLAMHAGLHVVLDDGRHFVVEQLAGGWREWLVDGLHWTPLEAFREREELDKGGWDATVPIEQFRQVDDHARNFAVTSLHHIRGRAFLQEDCTGFIGRVFGTQRRLFADSAILRWLGFDLRSGEPAMPLLRRDADLEPEVEARLHGNILRRLPDPVAESGSVSLRQLHHRLVIGAAIALVICALAFAVGNLRKRIG